MANAGDRIETEQAGRRAPEAAAAEPGPGEPGAGDSIVDFGTQALPDGGDSVVLSLADLLPDAAGEVVLFADEDIPINLMTYEIVTAEGIAEAHVTASGLDVTGLHYYSFESGITVYSPLDLLIVADPGTA